jgi:hypothetical protein
VRLRAAAIGGAAVVLAVALVAYFRPAAGPPLALDAEAPSVQGVPIAKEPSPVSADAEAPVVSASPPDEAARVPAGVAPSIDRAPLPGETPTTPMTNLAAGIGREGPPPQLVEGEREFAEEPLDGTWASGAEADVLAKFAQMPGLKLIDLQVECRSTMCRVQLTQPSPPLGSPQPFKALLEPLGLEPRWSMTIKDRANGPVKSAAYLWRDGFAPPKPGLATRQEANEEGEKP